MPNVQLYPVFSFCWVGPTWRVAIKLMASIIFCHLHMNVVVVLLRNHIFGWKATDSTGDNEVLYNPITKGTYIFRVCWASEWEVAILCWELPSKSSFLLTQHCLYPFPLLSCCWTGTNLVFWSVWLFRYFYRMLSGPEPLSTFEKERAWHVPEELNILEMKVNYFPYTVRWNFLFNLFFSVYNYHLGDVLHYLKF